MTDQLAGLTIVAGERDEQSDSETARPIVKTTDDLYTDVLDIAIDMNRLAMQVVILSRKRTALTRKLDDPANANDPRRGEAEAMAYRYWFDRTIALDDIKAKAKRVDRIVQAQRTQSVFISVLWTDDLSYAMYRSSLARVIMAAPDGFSTFWQTCAKRAMERTDVPF